MTSFLAALMASVALTAGAASAPAPVSTAPAESPAPAPAVTTDQDEDVPTPTAPITGQTPAPSAPAAAPPPAMLSGPGYDAAVRATSQSAQSMQGPIDGGWMLTGPGNERLYRFQFVDHGPDLDLAEGAWRDLKSVSRTTGSGFIATVASDGARLMLRFYETDANDLAVVTVKPDGQNWAGELWYRGVVTRVTLARAPAGKP